MAMILDAFLSDLSKTVIYATQTTANFKPQLKLLTATLQRIKPIIDDMVNLNRKLDRSKQECLMFLDEIQNAQKLVVRCSKIKWDCIKMFLYSRKLENFNDKLLRFFQIEVQAIQIRNIAQILVMENDMNVKVDNISRNLSDMMKQRNGTVGNHGGEREKYGWHVPRLPSGIVAIGEPLEKLKAAVVGGCDDYSVVVVAAPGGCGKTTLVKMLCHDAKIQESFGENVFFVTVSETPNLMVIASDLFDPNSSRPRTLFQSNEDAKNKLENFFNQKASDPMLLVLDDVWSESVIEEIVPLKIKGHKILVTSRIAFPSPKYKAFRCDHLNEEDAKTLFCGSAFTEGWSRPTPTINDNLVNQMVKYSKGHPLTLCVLGRSLNGKDELAWKSMLGKLSQGRSILDLHKDVLIGLERSFEALDDELKQCFLDFGLFPEHQRIPIKTLLNMWMHLYDHDDDGVHTMATILELSYKNLVDLNTTIGNDSGTRIIYCDQQFVTQHDLMRELAIYLNSKLPFEHRTRVAINARGEDLPVSIENVQEPMQARILSISTGELFSSQWCNMEVPDLEVLILNLMSKTYTLPLFLAGLQKLKILNITNHGLYPTQFNNFHFLSSSHNLTRIRLEHVEVSPSILSLVNVQKVSFIMCKFGNPFKKLILNDANFWPQLVEIEIDYHLNVVDFPRTVCYNFQPKKNSITNDIMRLGKIGDFDKLLETLTPHMATPHMHALLKRLRVLLWKLELCNFSSISQLPKDGMLQLPTQEE